MNRNIVKKLEISAERYPDKIAMEYIGPSMGILTSLTFKQLQVATINLSSHLTKMGMTGQRVVLLYPPCIDFVVAFMACLRSGTIAVPLSLPLKRQDQQKLLRVLEDCAPKIIMTTDMIGNMPECKMLAQTKPEVDWLTTDSLLTSDTHDVPFNSQCDTLPEDVAFLQYTSGSTGQPKGVIVTHENIFSNEEMIAKAFNTSHESIGVSWLPVYHDMGLIGGVLQSIFCGGTTYLMSPLEFLESPKKWLQAIHEKRATISGGPNFAYDLCLKRISDEDAKYLDLSTWQVAFNGAEPVRARTLAAFTERFSKLANFSPSAPLPCYGLAEGTLLVSGGPHYSAPIVKEIDRSALESNLVAAGKSDIQFVASGVIADRLDTAIVHPEKFTRCAKNEIGEIWISGPSVASGYWNKPDETEKTFHATIHNECGKKYLRTGDLGFFDEESSQLFITGRLKDLIIVRGCNYYPQDIEFIAENSHPEIRIGCIAAFVIDEEQGPWVIAEVKKEVIEDVTTLKSIKSAINQAIAQKVGLKIAGVLLLKPGKIQKTTSGKIQRRACRAGVLSGDLICVLDGAFNATATTTTELTQQNISTPSHALVKDEVKILEGMTHAWCHTFKTDKIHPQSDFFALGGDSLVCAELIVSAADEGIEIEFDDIYSNPILIDLVRALYAKGACQPLQIDKIAMKHGVRYQASPQQTRYWKDYALDIYPQNWSHIFKESTLPFTVDPAVFADALNAISTKHLALRTSFERIENTIYQYTRERVHHAVETYDWTHLSPNDETCKTDELRTKIARTEFDLRSPPLYRVAIVKQRDGGSKIIFCIHHLICDAISLLMLEKELFECYANILNNKPLDISPPQGINYIDFSCWQNLHYRNSTRYAEDKAYWAQQLMGIKTKNWLPGDLDGRLDAVGCSTQFRLPPDIMYWSETTCKKYNFSPFSLFLAALCLHINEKHGDNDILIGSPASGRDIPSIRSIFGLMINLVGLRVRLPESLSIIETAKEVQRTVISAISHQLYQLDEAAEELNVERGWAFPFTSTFFSAIKFPEPAPTWNEEQDFLTTDLITDVRFDLMLYLYEYKNEMRIDIRHKKNFYSQELIQSIAKGIMLQLKKETK
jgi:acyl-CoA synthetase (AMP-forming)/AMP-acid ligase II